MSNVRIETALAIGRAMTDRVLKPDEESPHRPSKRTFWAMGDPQAPFERMLQILDHHGLLGDDGMLRPEVGLVSMGDHFDFGKDIDRAAEDGLALLSYLALHPPTQVVVLAGNHDLGRVGELADLDDATFAGAYAEAVGIYKQEGKGEAEADFLKRYPWAPTVELVARDFSAFRARQRELVWALLQSGRMQLAWSYAGKLLVHAGVTADDLSNLGLSAVEQRDAEGVARALNEHLQKTLKHHRGGALHIPSLHQPGDAACGEGRGIFYHRPELPPGKHPDQFEGPLRRRFDPRRIPLGLTQVLGHIRDEKCLKLLGDWGGKREPREGVLRSLVTDGHRGSYQLGTRTPASGEGALWFTDGGMNHSPVPDYQLLRLD